MGSMTKDIPRLEAFARASQAEQESHRYGKADFG
jgi:hypothetical protein